jgi:hypothetical protein
MITDKNFMCCNATTTSSTISIYPDNMLSVVTIDKPRWMFKKQFPFVHKCQKITLRFVEKRGYFKR